MTADTRSGRRFARVPEKAQVVGVERYTRDEILIAATRDARAILTKAEEVNFPLGSGAGRAGSCCSGGSSRASSIRSLMPAARRKAAWQLYQRAPQAIQLLTAHETATAAQVGEYAA